MKKASFIAFVFLLAAFAPALQSCQKLEPVQTIDAIVTVRPDAARNSVIFQLDEVTTAYPVNITGSDMGAEEKRALINFRKPDDDESIWYSSVGPQIFVNWMKFILTKPLAENYGEEENVEEYGEYDLSYSKQSDTGNIYPLANRQDHRYRSMTNDLANTHHKA